MDDISPNNPKCEICQHISSYVEVETLHTPDRLPKEVDRLGIIGGMNADYGLGQVRKCPKCGTYYAWFHDHDSESGTGYGYTDESIRRLTIEEAQERLKKNIEMLDRWITQAGKDAKDLRQHEVVRASARRRLEEHKQEYKRLDDELGELRKAYGQA